MRLSPVIAVALASTCWAAVPNQPSRVTVQGKQLIVEKRLPNGTLSKPVVYPIKGINWTPGTSAPAMGPDPTQGGKQVPYGFFFDDVPGNRWRSPGMQGHDLMNLWNVQQHQAQYQADIPLMAKMHVNTVRLFSDFGDNPMAYKPILDAFYENGIMVIMTVAAGKDKIDNDKYLTAMSYCQNHPAILMWLLGNEWNLSNPPFWGYATFPQAAAALDQAAMRMKAQDPNHPVSSSLGDSFPSNGVNDIATLVNQMPQIDIWALNVYRGNNFNTLAGSDVFAQWSGITTKPFYFSEFGTDSFRTTSYARPFGDARARVQSGHQDHAMQSSTDLSLWNEIKTRLSALDPSQPCVGGNIFQWNDVLWKVGNFNINLGNLVAYDGPDGRPGTSDDDTSYDSYNDDGFYLPGAHADDISNEEHFGIVTAGRTPKQAYHDLQAYYAALAPLPLESIEATPPTVSMYYNQTKVLPVKGLNAFLEPLILQPDFVWSVIPNAGVSISSSGVFSSSVTSGTYVVTASSGLLSASMSVVVSPLVLNLNFPSIVSVNGSLSINLPSDLIISRFDWTITPAPSAQSQTIVVSSAQGMLDLAAQRLTPGAYRITVQVFGPNGPISTISEARITLVAIDFSTLRVYPSPWRSDHHAGHPITFDGLPDQTTVKIFTVSGRWVNTLGPANTSLSWDLKNDDGDTVASGLYVYLLTTAQGQRVSGKFAVIR